MDHLEKPIIILGAARSGTKALAPIMRMHPDVAYLREPNYIWKYRNAAIGHDMIPAERATPEIREEIRRRFSEHMAQVGGTRFAEKTPANALRLPFLLKVLPDARVVHIYRDGRDVALSARNMWHGNNSKLEVDQLGIKMNVWNYTLRRMQEIPIRDLPHYLGNGVGRIMTHLGVGRPSLWGPHFPGMEAVARQYTLLEVCALQWRYSIEAIMNCARSPQTDMHYMELKYEALSAEPEKHLRRIFDFAELDRPANFNEMITHVRPGNTNKWARVMTDEEQERVHRHLSHTLLSLGYDVDATPEAVMAGATDR